MAGLWSRKFDYKNGEDRVCRKCNESFHANKPTYICKKCMNANQKIIGAKQREKIGKKQNYPFSTKTNDAGKRFSKISAKLNQVWRTGDRDLIRQHYADQLKEAEELGIIKWINDVRTDASKRENNPKTIEMTKKEYPDTRGHYED